MIAGCRVLVVDDEPLIVEVLRDLLERKGLLVSTAADGFEALRLLSSGPFDAVVTDLNMPGCDGAELIAEVRRRDSTSLPFIVLTGNYWAAAPLGGMGNVQVLRKPAGVEEIMTAIGTALQMGGRP